MSVRGRPDIAHPPEPAAPPAQGRPQRGCGIAVVDALKADRILLVLSLVILAGAGCRVIAARHDIGAQIQQECDLFYGPSGAAAVQGCLVEMRRRHFLPTTSG